MGKNKDKNKDEIPNPMSVTNRDILQRLNFLYQASVLLTSIAPPDSIHCDDDDPSKSSTTSNDAGTGTEEGDPPSRPTKSQKKKRRRVVGFEELSRGYVETMKSVGQKTNVKMDPSLKRRICKCCSAPLVPGISATVRIKDSSSHSHLISYQCHGCQTERRIPAPPILHVDPPTIEDMTEAQTAEGSTSSVPAAISSSGNSVRPGRQKRRKRGPQPRLPPHFARDIGHVVFRGNERLDTAHRVS